MTTHKIIGVKQSWRWLWTE